jgi:hypothetical protein
MHDGLANGDDYQESEMRLGLMGAMGGDSNVPLSLGLHLGAKGAKVRPIWQGGSTLERTRCVVMQAVRFQSLLSR